MKKNESISEALKAQNKADTALKKAFELARSDSNKKNKKLYKHLEKNKDHLESILTKNIESQNLEDSLIGVVAKKNNEMTEAIIKSFFLLPEAKRLPLFKRLQSNPDPAMKDFSIMLKNIIMLVTYNAASKRGRDWYDANIEMYVAVGESGAPDEKRESEIVAEKRDDAHQKSKVADEKKPTKIARASLRRSITSAQFPSFSPVDPDDTRTLVKNLIGGLQTQQEHVTAKTTASSEETHAHESSSPTSKVLSRLPGVGILTASSQNRDLLLSASTTTSSTHLSHPKSCLSSNYTKALIVFACVVALTSAAFYFVNMISKNEVGGGREL